MPTNPPGGLGRNYSTQNNPIPPIPGPKQDELTQVNAYPHPVGMKIKSKNVT